MTDPPFTTLTMAKISVLIFLTLCNSFHPCLGQDAETLPNSNQFEEKSSAAGQLNDAPVSSASFDNDLTSDSDPTIDAFDSSSDSNPKPQPNFLPEEETSEKGHDHNHAPVPEAKRKAVTCDLPNSQAQFRLLVGWVCPVLVNDPVSSYQLGRPFDLHRALKFSCGIGPGGGGTKLLAEWLPMVHIMNSTGLLDLLNSANKTFTRKIINIKTASTNASAEDKKTPLTTQKTENWCLLVNFYAPYCPFSAVMAQFYNALPRIFPRLYVVAIDATELSRLNSRYGIAGTPTILLWHNGKAVARYEDTVDEGLEGLVAFLMRWTDLDPVGETEVEEADLLGPLATMPVIGTDWHLIFSLIFICVAIVYYAARTSLVLSLWETLTRYWREAIEHAVVIVDEEPRAENDVIINDDDRNLNELQQPISADNVDVATDHVITHQQHMIGGLNEEIIHRDVDVDLRPISRHSSQGELKKASSNSSLEQDKPETSPTTSTYSQILVEAKEQ